MTTSPKPAPKYGLALRLSIRVGLCLVAASNSASFSMPPGFAFIPVSDAIMESRSEHKGFKFKLNVSRIGGDFFYF